MTFRRALGIAFLVASLMLLMQPLLAQVTQVSAVSTV